MATVYSVQKTSWDQTTPSKKIKPNESGGRVRVEYALYEAASLASGDVIEMFNLPDGARVLEGTLTHDAMASSTTLSVGHGAYTNAAGTAVVLDADEFFAAAASTAITTVAVAATSALGRNSVIDANYAGYPVTVTMGGAAGTGTVELQILYVVD
jgi:hypothetical protein|tara:strand:- start:2286 stop:2750 length:465 start_codon:yes stop_codon:yes gene_type:complete